MKVTAKQIAKELNISPAAVSMALNNKPGVSMKTRRIVLDTAKSLGYQMENKQTDHKCSISFIYFQKHYHTFTNPFFLEVIQGVEEKCREENIHLYIHHVFEYENIEDQLNYILEKKADGIILLATQMEEKDYVYFSELHIPVILLDSYHHSMDSVMIDNRESAYRASTYLIKKTGNQPGYLKSSIPLYNFKQRELGYRQAIIDNGLSIEKSAIHELSPEMEVAYDNTKALIENKVTLASCYFADNDDIAMGFMKAVKEAGYRIPEDISLIGFDNVPFSSYVKPSLTTMNVPKSYMGTLAVSRLMERIHDTTFHAVKIQVQTDMIRRKSIKD